MKLLYVASFHTEQEALNYTKSLINGGVIQQQKGKWLVFQIDNH